MSSGTVKCSSRSSASSFAKGEITYNTFATAIITVKSTASVRYPMPVAKPMAIAKNTLPISLALPGMLRKRTKLNTPITAMPAPKFPFTSVITICTISGKSASVSTKFREYLWRNI